MHYRNIWLALGILYTLFILIVSLLRMPDINIHISHTDKITHFLMYFILVGWFIQLYQNWTKRLLILLGAILLGLLIEYLQGMTSYRSFDYADEVSNAIGALCAFLLAHTFFDSLLERFDTWIYENKSK